jgi:hypothetical protein
LEKEPLRTVFGFLWPVLEPLMRQYESNYDIIEEIGRLLKHAMRKLEDQFAEFLPGLLNIVSDSFRRFQHSTYLYLVETAVRTFTRTVSNENQWLEKLALQMVNTSLP